MGNFEKEMQELINKNLPAHLSETLKERLELIPKLEKENDSLRKILDQERDYNKNLNLKLNEYMKYASIEDSLDRREKELREKEIKFEVECLKVQLAAEIYKTEYAREITLGLVRNTEYKKDVFNTKNIPGRTGENGMYIQPYSESSSSSEILKTD